MKYTYYKNSECILGPGPDPKKGIQLWLALRVGNVRLPFTIVTAGARGQYPLAPYSGSRVSIKIEDNNTN